MRPFLDEKPNKQLRFDKQKERNLAAVVCQTVVAVKEHDNIKSQLKRKIGFSCPQDGLSANNRLVGVGGGGDGIVISGL